MADAETLQRYGLQETDILLENKHEFVDIAKLGIKSIKGKSCLQCGIMRRGDGQNKPCVGRVAVKLRQG